MRPIRGILFDKDGTLVDFRATWMPAYRGVTAELATLAGRTPEFADRLLARLGYDPPTGAFTADSLLLWATNDELAAAWAVMPELAGIDVLAAVERHFRDLERYPPVPVGDLATTFARLHARGLALGIATMDEQVNADALVRQHGLDPFVRYVAGSDSGHGEKPGPGMVLGFCAAAGLAPAEVAVVGDTLADLGMARAAAAGAAVAVLTGATPVGALVLHADVVLDSILALEGWLDDDTPLASARNRG